VAPAGESRSRIMVILVWPGSGGLALGTLPSTNRTSHVPIKAVPTRIEKMATVFFIVDLPVGIRKMVGYTFLKPPASGAALA
jgi:hypothetical protein